MDFKRFLYDMYAVIILAVIAWGIIGLMIVAGQSWNVPAAVFLALLVIVAVFLSGGLCYVAGRDYAKPEP